MTGTPVIDPACDFTSGLSDADRKALMQTIPPAVLSQGFVCSNQQFNNLDLANYFTGLFGTLFAALGTLHQNTDLIDCLWQNGLQQHACDQITAQNFTQATIGNPPASITLPAGGSWDAIALTVGTQDTVGAGTGGNLSGGEIDDEDDLVVGVASGNFAGGTVFNADLLSTFRGGSLIVIATSVDCR